MGQKATEKQNYIDRVVYFSIPPRNIDPDLTKQISSIIIGKYLRLSQLTVRILIFLWVCLNLFAEYEFLAANLGAMIITFALLFTLLGINDAQKSISIKIRKIVVDAYAEIEFELHKVGDIDQARDIASLRYERAIVPMLGSIGAKFAKWEVSFVILGTLISGFAGDVDSIMRDWRCVCISFSLKRPRRTPTCSASPGRVSAGTRRSLPCRLRCRP